MFLLVRALQRNLAIQVRATLENDEGRKFLFFGSQTNSAGCDHRAGHSLPLGRTLIWGEGPGQGRPATSPLAGGPASKPMPLISEKNSWRRVCRTPSRDGPLTVPNGQKPGDAILRRRHHPARPRTHHSHATRRDARRDRPTPAGRVQTVAATARRDGSTRKPRHCARRIARRPNDNCRFPTCFRGEFVPSSGNSLASRGE